MLISLRKPFNYLQLQCIMLILKDFQPAHRIKTNFHSSLLQKTSHFIWMSITQEIPAKFATFDDPLLVARQQNFSFVNQKEANQFGSYKSCH